ncbi:Putative ATPase (AAA+ superfamily) [Idiomarina sp. A28L]|uniref:ATP-binding protein n=1 Tax=Idiomarina sp. A28L TaxID=1036674 RepID=UPI0002138D3C|nr:ATP-binding protein [Idiomarina sp. A28L]EGN75493.1 Putative ATPase (AAA+ superfamily) [Idiomarina sp. A28L]
MSLIYPRLAEQSIRLALKDTPVVLIHGSRQSGKTTLAKLIGEPSGYTYISFDDVSQLNAAKYDPVGFVQNLPAYCILDEIQRVPELFTSIKAVVDNQRDPGRFILTGSANILLLPTLADSLAGRMEVINLRPLSRAEISGRCEKTIFDELDNNQIMASFAPSRLYRLGSRLAEVVSAGGYPPALARATESRKATWYRDYVMTILQRDAQDLANIQHFQVLPKLLELSASQSARLFNVSDLAAPFSISRPTISNYLDLLTQLFMVELLQPYHNNRLSRAVKTPKLHLLDTGLACSLLGETASSLGQNRALLGQLLETFVYQELKKHSEATETLMKFYHYRDKDKDEVDIVVECNRKLYGFEVKAASTVTSADFKGLRKLERSFQEPFELGIVFYDGDKILPFGKGFYALPISVLM